VVEKVMEEDTINRLHARIAALKDALEVAAGEPDGEIIWQKINGLLEITEERLARLYKDAKVRERVQ
jgi:hypothetical protein